MFSSGCGAIDAMIFRTIACLPALVGAYRNRGGGAFTAVAGKSTCSSGTVRAIQSAALDWQISGVVDKVNVKVGDQVKKGDILATLDKSQLPQNVILAQSDLVNAQQALQDASSDTASAQAAMPTNNRMSQASVTERVRMR